MKKFFKVFLGTCMMTLGPSIGGIAGYTRNWILGIVSIAIAASIGAAGLSIIEHEFEGEE